MLVLVRVFIPTFIVIINGNDFGCGRDGGVGGVLDIVLCHGLVEILMVFLQLVTAGIPTRGLPKDVWLLHGVAELVNRIADLFVV